MTHSIRFVGLALILWTLGGGGSAAQQPAQAPPPLVKENATMKVSDHVYVILDAGVPLVPNVGIIVGSRGTVVVDTGLGPRNAQAILREAAKVSRGPDLYLVTTHFHPEHAAGSSAFPPSARIVISSAQQKDLDELSGPITATFASRSALTAELLKDVQYRRADVLFEREHTLDLGDVRVKLLSLGSMHTRGDTMLFVEGDGVLLSGDVVNHHAFLGFSQTSSGRAWLAALDQLDALRPRVVVPAHGPLGDSTSVGLHREVLRIVQARVKELKGMGKTADEAAQTLTTELQAKYTGWTGVNRLGGAVRAFYAEN